MNTPKTLRNRRLVFERFEGRRMFAVDLVPDVLGDSNRDGLFNSGDLTQVFQAGEYDDGVAENSDWSEGDWNGDGDFDSSDLVFAFQQGRYSAFESFFPAVVAAQIHRTGNNVYRISVTLSSPYDRPERYADAWRILGPECEELGVRNLTHDHQFEQPFTRSLSGVEIPEGVTRVTLQGRDQIGGWGGPTLTVDVPS